MIRFVFRVLATFSLAVAMVLAVLDATRSVAASQLVMTPMIDSWTTAFPGSLEATQAFIETRIAGFVWDPLLVTLLALPGFAVLAVIAILFYAVGHRTGRTRSEWA